MTHDIADHGVEFNGRYGNSSYTGHVRCSCGVRVTAMAQDYATALSRAVECHAEHRARVTVVKHPFRRPFDHREHLLACLG